MISLLVLFFSLSLFAQTNEERLGQLTNLKRIAFGSCNNQSAWQPLWKDMLKQRPDLFIWGGDNVYADWKSAESVKEAFEKQNGQPDYAAFKALTPIMGTWDDHDYGYDNANGHLSFKTESQKNFFDFIDIPKDATLRNQKGIYHSRSFLSEGREVKVIILDNRYFKDLDPEYPVLGKTQWKWFEDQLRNSTADLHFVATGLPVFSPLIPYTEEWTHYPNEINRLLEKIKTHKPRGIIFLTGDKHFSSIYIRYGQLEFMSSGLTHVAQRRTWWYLGRKYPNTYFGLSYGQIDIAWDEKNPVITLSMRGVEQRDIHLQRFKWSGEQWKREWLLDGF
jgi:alkaline phosphatase D